MATLDPSANVLTSRRLPVSAFADGSIRIGTLGGECAMNFMNEGYQFNYGLYAFHTGRANAAMMDGTIRFLHEGMTGQRFLRSSRGAVIDGVF